MSTLDLLKAASELFDACMQDVGGNVQRIIDDTPTNLTPLELAQVTALAEQNQAEDDATEYARSRLEAYNALNQMELISDDSINGTTTHKDAILAIKAEFPKP